MQERHPELLQRCARLSADKGYDDHKLINRLWDQHQIKPIIAIRNCWQDGEADHDGVVRKLVRGQQNVIYTYDGAVSCVCPRTGAVRSMDYGGFERDRETLKYRCPARYSGATCKGIQRCPVGDAVRIRLGAGGATPFCGTIMPRPAFRQVAEGQKANVGGRGHSVNS